jgi:threonine aldolase
MRFFAAPWIGLLQNNVWLGNAARANNAAKLLAKKLRALGLEIVYPCDANAVFVRIADPIANELQRRGWQFYKFIEPDIYRLMCSWSVTEDAIADFVRDVTDAVNVNIPRERASKNSAESG